MAQLCKTNYKYYYRVNKKQLVFFWPPNKASDPITIQSERERDLM